MKSLVKLIIIFTLSFVVLLGIMIIVVKMSRPDPSALETVMADSAAVSGSLIDNSRTVSSPEPVYLVDSLQVLVSQIKSEKEHLQKQLEQIQSETKPEETVTVTNARQLAKIYENMEPQDAAMIMTTLNLNMAVEIISSMKERQAARVLSSMDPQRAAEISRKIISNR
jgi:flagellar protein FlbB